MCDGLGLSEGQRNRQLLNMGNDIVISKGISNLILPTKGGKQDILCIRHDFVPLWLAKITITPAMKQITPDLVDKLVDYQLKAKDVLAEAFLPKKEKKAKQERVESLSSVNNAVKTITPILEAVGCTPQIQLLTAKSLYEKAGVSLPIKIPSDKHYVDTVHIARHEIIRRLNLPESMYAETWESKGNWQGAVRKYDEAVIGMVRQWYCDNGYPRNIEYTQCDGQKKCYHVIWHDADVA